MKINFEMDESEIIRAVMNGRSKKEIIEEVKKMIKDEITSYIYKSLKCYREDIEQSVKNDVQSKLKEDVLAYVKSKLTPVNIKKMLHNNDGKRWLEDSVGAVLANYVETALSEWLVLEFNIKARGKTTRVELCGRDSYTHRRK